MYLAATLTSFVMLVALVIAGLFYPIMWPIGLLTGLLVLGFVMRRD